MTPEQLEKKKLKAEYKQNQKERKLSFEQLKKENTEPKKDNRILIGLVEGEKLLPDDYPVHGDYLYVEEYAANEFRVIMSPVFGNVARLKYILNSKSTKPCVNIYSCNLLKRNLI
jgi:hypothetical protein